MIRFATVAPLVQHVSNFDQMLLADSAVRRLGVACVLGAAIGLERELSRKAAGIRTNVFVCMACAFFTFLSIEIAGPDSPNKGQIAANIVQGIGFLGAGLILRNRYRVAGLTSAATVFVVASIGMACGAGFYIPASFAAGIVIMAMFSIGAAERYLNIKTYPLIYELRGSDDVTVNDAALSVLDKYKRRLNAVESGRLGEVYRLVFGASANTHTHRHLLRELRAASGVSYAIAYKEDDEE